MTRRPSTSCWAQPGLTGKPGVFANSTGMLIHADNAMSEGLQPFDPSQSTAGCPATMLTFKTDNPSSCGIVGMTVTIDQGFHEKMVSHPATGLTVLSTPSASCWITSTEWPHPPVTSVSRFSLALLGAFRPGTPIRLIWISALPRHLLQRKCC